MKRVSRLMHGHVIPNGTYRFADEETVIRMYADAGYRPCVGLPAWIGLACRFADWTECCSNAWQGRTKRVALPGVVGVKAARSLLTWVPLGANALVEPVDGDAELF